MKQNEKKEQPTQNKEKTAYIYIPEDSLNPYEETVQVTLNGKGWTIARGVGVEVPLEVAKILFNAKYINSYKEL